MLAPAPGWAPRALAGTLAGLSLLHARVLTGAWQRLSAAAAGLYGAGLLVVVTTRHTPAAAAGVAVALALVALCCVVAARTVPGRRPMPYWTSLANAAQWLAAVSLVPQVLLVAGVYHLARSR